MDEQQEGVSVKATYADAVLASRKYLDKAAARMDECERVANEAFVALQADPLLNEDRWNVTSQVIEKALPYVHELTRLGQAYAELARACSKVPGERF